MTLFVSREDIVLVGDRFWRPRLPLAQAWRCTCSSWTCPCRILCRRWAGQRRTSRWPRCCQAWPYCRIRPSGVSLIGLECADCRDSAQLFRDRHAW